MSRYNLKQLLKLSFNISAIHGLSKCKMQSMVTEVNYCCHNYVFCKQIYIGLARNARKNIGCQQFCRSMCKTALNDLFQVHFENSKHTK